MGSEELCLKLADRSGRRGPGLIPESDNMENHSGEHFSETTGRSLAEQDQERREHHKTAEEGVQR